MNTKRFQPSILAAVIAVLAGSALIPATAHANLLTNGSFEDTTHFVGNSDDTMVLSAGDSTDMPGWTVTGPLSLAWIGPTNDFGLTAEDGGYFLDLTGYNDTAPYSGVSQTIATSPGSSYQLSFWLGSSSTYGLPDGILAATAGGTSKSFTSTDTGPNNWELETLDFTATSSTTNISLIGDSGFKYIGLDNVSVDQISTVPEPSSLALLAGALLGLGALGRRRKSA